MGLALQVLMLSIAIALVLQRSAGSNISPSPSIFTANPPTEEVPDIPTHDNAPSPASAQIVSQFPPVLPPVRSAPNPIQTVPSLSPVSSSPPAIGIEIGTTPPQRAPIAEEPINSSPKSSPVAPIVTPTSSISPPIPSSVNPIIPGSEPPTSVPSIPPMNKAPPLKPIAPEPVISPTLTPPPSGAQKGDGVPVASPPKESSHPISPEKSSPIQVPQIRNASRHHNNIAPFLSPKSPPAIEHRAPASLPSTSPSRYHHKNGKITSPPPSSHQVPRPPPIDPAPYPSKSHASSGKKRFASPPSPYSSSKGDALPAFSPSPRASPSPGHATLPSISPNMSPIGSSPRPAKQPLIPQIHSLPPPPPNEDCLSLTCADPLTNTPPRSPCRCVLPMQVGLRLGVALYTFFPLVSQLAEEISVGVFMRQSQVRVMGANAASQDPEKTIILIDLVPLGEKFDNTTAYLTSERFWNKQVVINTSTFGNYDVLYVRYPGLPPSPPSSINIMDGEPFSGHENNRMKPLGVDVSGSHHKHRLGGSVLAIIVLSASVVIFLSCAIAWVILSKRRRCQEGSTPPATPPFISKPSGIAASMLGSVPSISTPLSIGSSMAPYTGSAKTFSSMEIEIATNNFDDSRVLGEGGFGRVYSGALVDGTNVAVKVLKRDDQQGGREFLAEVEMLSRLHHRNLVKLIGICTEDRARCLVYELITNGSVESHLHGVDKEIAPLDWGARLKIALGSARALAYLHEDSSPRVIHRDFKASNILLEDDYTPKVSDFGLARTALDEDNKHISTRVMGTFGYVAPEYAMTGHLLVKSDVYSYGVVLLELLTGRKPVDMSQPPGEENLVAWARPLLTNQEDLESIIDSSLGPDFPFNSIAKVSAIASMCVQPEVSHRPFMGEVVQALKLVCDEDLDPRSCMDIDDRLDTDYSSHVSNYDDGEFNVESGFSVSVSDVYRFKRLEKQNSGSFRRHSSSGPLITGKGDRVWWKLRRLSGGTVSEHGTSFQFRSGSH